MAAIGIGWFILNPGDTFDYVATVDSELTELENELAALDAQVAAGTLTESQATEAKVKIITRLDTINTAATNSEKATLTAAQRAQLSAGLDRLKVILVTYSGTLTTVEATANDTNVKAELARRGGSNSSKKLNLIVADVIADVEETVADSVQDYEANAELDAQIDDVVTEVEAEATTDEEMSDEGTMEDADMESGDDMDDAPMDEADMSDEPMLDAEVSAEAELGTTTN